MEFNIIYFMEFLSLHLVRCFVLAAASAWLHRAHEFECILSLAYICRNAAKKRTLPEECALSFQSIGVKSTILSTTSTISEGNEDTEVHGTK